MTVIGGELRNWYLSALGVVRYIPRDSSEAAARREPQPEPVPAADSAPQSRPQPQLRQLLDDKPETTQPAAPTAVEAPAVAPEHSQQVQCRLAFWQPSRELVVLSSLSSGARPTPAQLAMLSRLLKAIGQLEGTLPAFDLIDWPQAPGASATLGDAREFLSVFLDAKAFLEPFRYALVMGEVSARLIMPAGALAAGSRAPLACGAEGIVTHSLSEMEQDPSLKAPTWEAIKFLAGQ